MTGRRGIEVDRVKDAKRVDWLYGDEAIRFVINLFLSLSRSDVWVQQDHKVYGFSRKKNSL